MTVVYPEPMDNLKPCPFCGGQPAGWKYQDIMTNWGYYVSCHSCAGEGGWDKTKSGAIRNWNTRVDTDEKEKELNK